MTQNADPGALICCDGCGSTDPTALIFMTNASWAAVRCGPCAIYLLTVIRQDRSGVTYRQVGAMTPNADSGATECDAKIRPMPNDTEIRCENGTGPHVTHGGRLRDYSYPGSVTKVTWLDDDRRNFRGDWAPCDSFRGCILPNNHSGRHAT